MLGVLLAGACTSMYMRIPRGTSLTCRISDPHHPTQGEGVSPQVECTHVVRLFRLRRTLMVSVVVESSPALMALQVRQTVLGRVVTVAAGREARRQGLRPGPSCMPTPVGGI